MEDLSLRPWRQILGEALLAALKTSRWLLSLMIPVSFGVMLLQYSGWLAKISEFLNPLFQYLGLSGQSALVFLTSVFLNIYSAIAVITTLTLTPREITILAFMCLVSHNVIVEVLILKRTGSNALRMLLIRLITSIVGAFILNLLLPDTFSHGVYHTLAIPENANFSVVFKKWGISTLFLSGKVILFVTGLMILQKSLEKLGVLKLVGKALSPVLRLMGLPRDSAFLWLVANVLGLGYSAAIMFEHAEKETMSRSDNDLLNHHIAVCHSLLEDTLLFVAIGVPAGWITFPRLIAATGIVWTVRLFRKR